MVNHRLCGHHAHRRPKAVCHEHEQPLRTRAQPHRHFLVHEQRTRNIEEIERHAIHKHRQYEKKHPRHGRVTQGEEPEAEYPRKHSHEHDTLYTKTLEKERYKQYAHYFGQLR